MLAKHKTVLLLASLIVFLFSSFAARVEAQYLFEDGFEGTDEAWTEVNNPDLNCATVVHHGSEASESQITAAAGNNYSYANFAKDNTIYARAYINLDEISGTGQLRYAFSINDQSSNTICGFRVDGADRSVIMEYWDGSLLTVDNDSAIISLDTWYCIELYAFCDNSAGECKIWVDESLTHSQTGLDTKVGGNQLDEVAIGCGYGWPTTRLYGDCVVVDTSYIGPEAAGAEYTETFSESVSVSESGSFKGAYSRMQSETVSTTATFVYLGRSTMHFFTETVTVEGATYFWCGKLCSFNELVNVVSQGFFTKELSVVEVEEFFTETILQDGTLSVWREKLVTVSESPSFLAQLGKWIALMSTSEEAVAASSGFDRWRSLYTVFSETVSIVASETMQGEFAFTEALTVWETIQPQESAFMWRELSRTFYSPVSVGESAEKFIALMAATTESVAVSATDAVWRGLWFTTTETVNLASSLTALAESLLTSVEFLETVIVTPSETFTPELAVAVPSINDVYGLAALAFIIALAAVALVVNEGRKG